MSYHSLTNSLIRSHIPFNKWDAKKRITSTLGVHILLTMRSIYLVIVVPIVPYWYYPWHLLWKHWSYHLVCFLDLAKFFYVLFILVHSSPQVISEEISGNNGYVELSFRAKKLDDKVKVLLETDLQVPPIRDTNRILLGYSQNYSLMCGINDGDKDI